MRFFVTLLLFCVTFSVNAQNATVSGKVIDNVTKQPVPGAKVTLTNELRAKSDFDGNYSISNVPFGKYSLVVTMLSFDTTTYEINIDKEDSYLINHFWPGNVRELRNLIERIAILSNNDQSKIKTIIKESIKQGGIETLKSNNLSVPLKEARENFEKEYLTTQLKKFGGNISKTAKFVGMERSALHRKLKGLGVKDLN